MNPSMYKAAGDGIRIQIAEWCGKSTTVFCVHGLTANCRSFDAVAAGISPPHRVLAIDLRGRGLSDKPESGYSIAHHCRDISAVVGELKLNEFCLMGHSLGAYVALAYAARHPQQIKGLILLDAGASLSAEQWQKIAVGIKPSLDRLGKTYESFEDYLAQIRQAPFMQPWSETLENYFRYESRKVGEGGRRSRIDPAHIAEERSNLLLLDPDGLYPAISCPVLILRATEPMITGGDFVLPEDALPELLAALPQARLINLEGLNHYSLVMQPSDQRDQAILKFLSCLPA
jgi:pimeloyl-ACP methyl ester carboxylesterase